MAVTLKQKRVFQKVCKGMSIRGAMKEVGYSETTAHNSTKLTQSDGWKELMNKYLPDSKLAKVHSEGLQASKKVFRNNNETGEVEEVGEEADYSVRHKYLDTAYKLKGSYAAEKKATVNLNLNADVQMDEKTAGLRDEYEKKLFEELSSN